MTSAPATPPAIGWRGLAWAVAPPLAVLLLRTLLTAQADVDADSLQRLKVATMVSAPGEAIWAAARPFVFTLVALAVLGAALFFGGRRALRRHGWPHLRPWAVGAWLLLWLAAGSWLLAAHLNRAGRQPLADQDATVLLVGAVAPSTRGPGGAEVYVQLPGQPQPLHLFAPEQPAQAFPVGSTVRLHTEAGRWWGRWGRVTPAGTPGAG